MHQSHRKFNNVRPLITLSLLFMTHETIIRFSLYLIAIKLLASAFFPQTFRLLFELAIFAIDFSGFSKEYTETVVSIWLFFYLCVCGFDNERNFFSFFFRFVLPFFSIFVKFVFTVFRQHFGKRSVFPINLLKYYCYLSLDRR